MNFSFLPAEVKFYDYFEKASGNLLDSARLLQNMFEHCCDDLDNQVAQITELEHKGDFIVHEVTELLPRTLITPIDTDDIQRLISSVDDAVDALEATAARLQIYQINQVNEPARRLARLITDGATELHAAMKGLRDKQSYGQTHARVVQINTIENNADRVLRDGLLELVAHRGDVFDFIRWKEIYELLEQTTDRIEDAADVMTKVMIENA